MINKLLIQENSQISCQTENKLSKDQSVLFARAVTKMALAKNIQLAQGTLSVWEECLMEDLSIKQFELEDFVTATNKLIREKLYNRIDYADIYELAKTLGRDRMMKTINDLPVDTSPNFGRRQQRHCL